KVAEDQKARAERPHFAQRESVEYRSHGVFADAEVQVAAAVVPCAKVAGAVDRQPRLAGWGQVGRTTHEPWDVLRQGIQHRAGCFARSLALWVRRKGRQALVPTLGELAALHPEEAVGQFRVLLAVFLKAGLPGLV